MKHPFLYYLWIFAQFTIGYNLILPFLQFCLFKLRLKKRNFYTQPASEPDFAIIVTAYEQTYSLKAVVDSLLTLNYQNYLIYVVADKCDMASLQFDDKRVIVLKPEETLSSNTKSHFYAIKRFKREHKFLTIIDSDNLVEPQYLNELNVFFNKGFLAVQGVRKAKNLDTTYACLDAARDIYYHFYDGEILFNIGSSATLAGSGMAFTVQLYRNCLEHLEVTGAGFDKVLQAEIVKQDHRIAYNGRAVVFDEKTSRSDQLVKQRARWINTWFRYFIFGFKLVGRGIIKLSWNQFMFGLVLLRPPLFIFLLSSFVCLIVNFFIAPLFFIFWLIAFGIFIASFFIALLHSKTEKKIYQSLLNIPVFMYYQILSLFKVRKANMHSVATQHFHNQTIEDVKL